MLNGNLMSAQTNSVGCERMKSSGRLHRVVIMLEGDAYLLLEGLTTPRRKSAYLAELIRRAAAEKAAEQAAQQAAEHPQEIQLLQSIEERLERIEDKLDEVGKRIDQPRVGQEAPE